jgi:hypothetical protein
MTDDARFQLFQRLNDMDVRHITEDDLQRLRSEMRKEMMSKGHRSWQGLSFFKQMATLQSNGMSFWESHPEYRGFLWETAGEIYTEWKLLEDDDFWTAAHHA